MLCLELEPRDAHVSIDLAPKQETLTGAGRLGEGGPGTRQGAL